MEPIIAQLVGDTGIAAGICECSALGVTARGAAPVIELCRKLVAAGVPSASPMRVYRGEELCLHVGSIGEASGLQIQGRRFVAARKRVAADEAA
jgi:hypothetical protein